MPYFTERDRGPRPRTSEDISIEVASGIVSEIQRCISDGSFGASYPALCPEYDTSVIGTDFDRLGVALTSRFPVRWPLAAESLVGDLVCLNLVEFTFEKIGEPSHAPQSDRHASYYNHRHLEFDQDQGRARFRKEINDIFALNGMAFELERNGQIVRLTTPVLGAPLAAANFWTGDSHLDTLLEDSRKLFMSPDPGTRKDALDKLWDAFERLKTLMSGSDKKAQIAALLARAVVKPEMRERVDAEMQALTKIGNDFFIRHAETTKIPLSGTTEVDYLFHRMFALIRFLLRGIGKGA